MDSLDEPFSSVPNNLNLSDDEIPLSEDKLKERTKRTRKRVNYAAMVPDEVGVMDAGDDSFLDSHSPKKRRRPRMRKGGNRCDE